MKHSTLGRPRSLTEAEVLEILEWHSLKRTNAQMAARYGIARGTLEAIVRTEGKGYKKAPKKEVA